MCAYPHSDHALLHWKGDMWCYVKCTNISLHDQETYDQYFDTSPSIRFHIYHIISRCSTHDRLLLNDKKICHKCEQEKYTLEKSY